jgi:hypothetical protein
VNRLEARMVALMRRLHPDRVRYLLGYIEGRYDRP